MCPLMKWNEHTSYCSRIKKYEKAAELGLRLEKFEEAAKLFEQAQQPLKAAQLYEKLGNTKVACVLRGEDAFARGQTLDAAAWFLKAEDHIRAAELFEWEKQYEKSRLLLFYEPKLQRLRGKLSQSR